MLEQLCAAVKAEAMHECSAALRDMCSTLRPKMVYTGPNHESTSDVDIPDEYTAVSVVWDGVRHLLHLERHLNMTAGEVRCSVASTFNTHYPYFQLDTQALAVTPVYDAESDEDFAGHRHARLTVLSTSSSLMTIKFPKTSTTFMLPIASKVDIVIKQMREALAMPFAYFREAPRSLVYETENNTSKFRVGHEHLMLVPQDVLVSLLHNGVLRLSAGSTWETIRKYLYVSFFCDEVPDPMPAPTLPLAVSLGPHLYESFRFMTSEVLLSHRILLNKELGRELNVSKALRDAGCLCADFLLTFLNDHIMTLGDTRNFPPLEQQIEESMDHHGWLNADNDTVIKPLDIPAQPDLPPLLVFRCKYGWTRSPWMQGLVSIQFSLREPHWVTANDQVAWLYQQYVKAGHKIHDTVPQEFLARAKGRFENVLCQGYGFENVRVKQGVWIVILDDEAAVMVREPPTFLFEPDIQIDRLRLAAVGKTFHSGLNRYFVKMDWSRIRHVSISTSNNWMLERVQMSAREAAIACVLEYCTPTIDKLAARYVAGAVRGARGVATEEIDYWKSQLPNDRWLKVERVRPHLGKLVSELLVACVPEKIWPNLIDEGTIYLLNHHSDDKYMTRDGNFGLVFRFEQLPHNHRAVFLKSDLCRLGSVSKKEYREVSSFTHDVAEVVLGYALASESKWLREFAAQRIPFSYTQDYNGDNDHVDFRLWNSL